MTFIEVNLANVSKEEIKELEEYLERNCWKWRHHSYLSHLTDLAQPEIERNLKP